MKRIVLLMCGLLLLVANTAEARRGRHSQGTYYAQPTYAQPSYAAPAQPAPAKTTVAAPASQTTSATKSVPVKTAALSTTASKTTTAKQVPAQTVSASKTATTSLSTATAQGVANIMASCGRVGHWGGNPGYEGCGMGATKEAAYNCCCYANSGMATVDVGYAQGANGWWYCCRRYR